MKKNLKKKLDKNFIRNNRLYLARLATVKLMIDARDSAIAFNAGQEADLSEFVKALNSIAQRSGLQIEYSLDRAKALALDTNQLNSIVVAIDTGIIELFKRITQLDKVPDGQADQAN